ncbi:CYTH domain-containing protein [Parasphaerochaeta coccoides]|uniref:Adenylate cyclase n=1 Tax=Parasphaerochaeta coccoides (strain ATCC BAA-1237 / DSM 17374 / SPN1) TaxID=760011 RepID=F4GLI8_PARC1|nr:CYTH domain-containing protein [Parasphaerochaeta coccoides]AEC01958.1 adenylate cyclase [Parasphaerochaeta coccoides DSM 17374]
MSSEIELKARVTEPFVLKALISTLPGISSPRVIAKKDVYYTHPLHGGPWFRVRSVKEHREQEKEEGSIVFTHKVHGQSDGIENNCEQEFFVDIQQEKEVFAFCSALGMQEYIRKEKRGWAWWITEKGTHGFPLHLELLEVSPLGWFLEMEYVLPDAPDVKDVKKAQENLQEMLNTLGIKKSAIESRYYMDMLKAGQISKQEG